MNKNDEITAKKSDDEETSIYSNSSYLESDNNNNNEWKNTEIGDDDPLAHDVELTNENKSQSEKCENVKSIADNDDIKDSLQKSYLKNEVGGSTVDDSEFEETQISRVSKISISDSCNDNENLKNEEHFPHDQSKSDTGKEEEKKKPPKSTSSTSINTKLINHPNKTKNIKNFSPQTTSNISSLDISLDSQQVLLKILNQLVNQNFHHQFNFEPNSPKSLLSFFDSVFTTAYLNEISQALLLTFCDIVASSCRTRRMCTQLDLDLRLMEQLEKCENERMIPLIVKALSHIMAHNLTISKLTLMIKRLSPTHQLKNSNNSIHIVKILPLLFTSIEPSSYFVFSQEFKTSCIDMPPITKWNQHYGWTFHTWFKLGYNVSSDDKLYLFSFGKKKSNIGYSAYFIENKLILTISKIQGKIFEINFPKKFVSNVWCMLDLVFEYKRWSTSTVTCFVNGENVMMSQTSWLVSSCDEFDHCCIGNNAMRDSSFRGQLGNVYLFSMDLSEKMVEAIYRLGADYNGGFESFSELKSHVESDVKFLYDTKLNKSLVFKYASSNCEDNLCLETTIHSDPNSDFYNNETSHAYLNSGVLAVSRHLPTAALHSIGGIQIIYPVFQLLKYSKISDLTATINVAEYLIEFVVNFISTSDEALYSFIETNGFTVISVTLSECPVKLYITQKVVNHLFLLYELIEKKCTNWILHAFIDCFFLNPDLWIYSSSEAQLMLYEYFHNVCIATSLQNDNINRHEHYVRQLLYMLRFYYWIDEPELGVDEVCKCTANSRPSIENLQQIRSILLKCTLVFISSKHPHSNDIQALINYLLLVKEDDNIHDVLILYIRLILEFPHIGVPSFTEKNAIHLIIKLLESNDPMIRTNSLKLFGYFLMHSSDDRKTDTFENCNLATLIAFKIMSKLDFLDMKNYNVLYEIMIDVVTPFVSAEQHPPIMKSARLQNPEIIIVIISCFDMSNFCNQLLQVKLVFLKDLHRLFFSSSSNRRLLLQITVWQNWLYSLFVHVPSSPDEMKINELIVGIFTILLHHAIKFEVSGWRVWVDSISIIHSIDSLVEYRRISEADSMGHVTNKKDPNQTDLKTKSKQNFVQDDSSLFESERSKISNDKNYHSDGAHVDEKNNINSTTNGDINDDNVKHSSQKEPSFGIPPFKWSHIQHTLFCCLLKAIEEDVSGFSKNDSFTDGQVIYMVNIIQTLTQLADIFSFSCGGIIGLLGISSTGNSSVELIDVGSETLKTSHAVGMILRFCKLLDVCCLNSYVNMNDLENEKHLPKGSLHRLLMRMAILSGLRNYFECYFKRENVDITEKSQISVTDTQLKVLLEMAKTRVDNTQVDETTLLQQEDYLRMGNILKACSSDPNTSKSLSLSVMYFLSVLTVSRYRDILEDDQQNATLQKKEYIDRGFVNAPIHSSPQNDQLQENKDESTLNNTNVGRKESIESTNETSDSLAKESASSIQIISSKLKNDVFEQALKYAANVEDTVKLPQTVKLDHVVAEKACGNSQVDDKIFTSLGSTVDLIKDLFRAHKGYFTKTLIGSHGQDIYTPAAYCFEKSTSLVQVVMLLCSQEWQNSLLTHAGLSFIELANEGRMLSYAVQDHIIRVANEAEFLMNKMKADDVDKHFCFQKRSNKAYEKSKLQEITTEYMVSSYRRQNTKMVYKHLKYLDVLFEERYHDDVSDKARFFYICNHEDDLRRRYKLERNVEGNCHEDAVILYRDVENEASGKVGMSGDQKDGVIYSNLSNESKVMGKPFLSENSSTEVALKRRISNDTTDDSNINKLQKQVSTAESYAYESNIIIQRELYSADVLMQTECCIMSLGVKVSGTLYITNACLYFDVDAKKMLMMEQQYPENKMIVNYINYSAVKVMFYQIRAVFKRKSLHKFIAVEIFTTSKSSVMIILGTTQEVKNVINLLPAVGIGNKYGLASTRETSLLSPAKQFNGSDMTERWSKRETSNFEYLMFLNTISGRTYNDPNQYFIFPWILTNYESKKLDLSMPSNYRDLSKPVGALNPSRLKHYEARYENWDTSSNIPAFHYGTHYSTAAFTSNWLIRQEPYTSLYLKIQSGKFYSSRIFKSLSESWKSCQTDVSDVKELIPEFFYLPEMFINSNNYNFGYTEEKGEGAYNVQLPPWASNAEEFVRIHRMALESDMVSCQLHQWIDLIFGYKQTGPEAVKAKNMFYHLTYEYTDISKVQDATTKEALEHQIAMYGQTPSFLTKSPHVARRSILTTSPQIFKNKDIYCVVKFNSHAPIIKTTFCHVENLKQNFIVCISETRSFSINKWQLNETEQDSKKCSNPIVIDPVLVSRNYHRRCLEGRYFDQRNIPSENCFIVTPDSKFVICGGSIDFSFRVFNLDTAKISQSIYGHYGRVTCLKRFNKISSNRNFLFVSGSTDSTIKLWSWDHKKKMVYGSMNESGSNPIPVVTICGHDSAILDIFVLVEMGIIFSLSQDGLLLTHNISGENMQTFSINKSVNFSKELFPPSNIHVNSDGLLFVSGLKKFSTKKQVNNKDDVPLSKNSFISVYNYMSARLLKTQTFDILTSIVNSNCGRFLVTGSVAGCISIIRSHDLFTIYTYYPCTSAIRTIELSMDQNYIISGLSDGSVTIFGVNFAKWYQEYQDSYTL